METNINESKLLTPKEVANILGLNQASLRNWRWKGSGPVFIKVGHLVRYKQSDVNKFIEEQSRTSTSDNSKNKNED